MSKADGIKGLKLIFDPQPDGSKKMRKWFYGQFWNPNTKKPTAVNLHVRVKGKPPASGNISATPSKSKLSSVAEA